jgi:hypothetical protein
MTCPSRRGLVSAVGIADTKVVRAARAATLEVKEKILMVAE